MENINKQMLDVLSNFKSEKLVGVIIDDGGQHVGVSYVNVFQKVRQVIAEAEKEIENENT